LRYLTVSVQLPTEILPGDWNPMAANVSEVRLPDATNSIVPWRRTGVRYASNEIYIDIIEELDAIIDR
jgi:hypothetical protein